MKKILLLFCFLFSLSLHAVTTINVTTAGTLTTLISTQDKAIITDLTLTGNIDARDVKCMRDELKKLAILDISEVNIIAYTGTSGTAASSSTIYPANEIPANSFYDPDWIANTALKTIKLPNSITSIGNSAFESCKGLFGPLTIPNSVITIGESAFKSCKGITGSLIFPNSVTSIGGGSFYDCTGLDGILTLSSSLTSIGRYAFWNCIGLNGLLTIPDNVKTIEEDAFYDCFGFTGNLKLSNSLTAIGAEAFAYCNGLTGNLKIPNTVTSLGASAFRNCTGFTGDLTLPNSIAAIENNTFTGCSGFTGNLRIPNSVTSIGSNAFSFCSGFTKIYAGNAVPPVVQSSTFDFINRYGCTIEVPAGAITAYQAANYWKEFATIVEFVLLPSISTNSVSSITNTSASSGGNITTLDASPVIARGVCWSTTANPTISDYKTADGVGTGVFTSSITGLTSGLTYHIRAYATNSYGTSYGEDLTFATLGTAPTVTTTAVSLINTTTTTAGGNVTSEGSTPVTVRGVCWSTAANPTTSNSKTTDGSASGVFVSSITGLTSNTTYHIRAYATNSVGTSYGNDITFKTLVNDPTVTIDVANAGALTTLISAADKATITNLILTGNIDARDVKCLRDELTKLAVLDISAVTIDPYVDVDGTVGGTANRIYPASEMPMSSFCFPDGTGKKTLTSIILPNSITSIGSYSFKDCSGLINVIIPNSVVSIGENAFYWCKFNNMIIGSSVKTIGYGAFWECINLVSIKIPASLTTLGSYAFGDLWGLKEFIVDPDNLNFSSVDGILFNKNKTTILLCPQNKNVPNYDIPNTVVAIGGDAFEKCHYLSSVTIPASLTTIGNEAFGGCTKLKEFIVAPENTNFSTIDGNLYSKDKTALVVYAGGKTGNFIIPDNVTSIRAYAFYNCQYLTGITIGNSVKSIGSSAFGACWSLKAVSLSNTTPINLNSSYSVFFAVDAKCSLYIPVGSKAAYQAAYIWKDFTNIVEGSLPTVSTDLIGSITATTAIAGGNVISDGTSSVTSRGVCWNLNRFPTISDNKTVDGAGTGIFTSSLTGLSSATTYYVRAYATSSVGTYYGDELTFTTLASPPTISTIIPSSISKTTAIAGGNITSAGNSKVTVRGICWSTSANPTTADNKTTDGSGIGIFTSTLTGLISGVTYHIRAYATSIVGTSYGDDLIFSTLPTAATVTTSVISSITSTTAVVGGNVTSAGTSPVTSRGVCWSTSANPTTLDNITTDGAGEGLFTSSITGLTSGVTYHYRAYVTTSVRTSYGSDLTFTTLGIAPTVTTTAASSITSTTATIGGNVTNAGTSSVTARGVCWSTSANPTTDDNKTNDGTGAGVFSSSLIGLTSGLTYHIRAYATSAVGTSYGADMTFTTLVTAPTVTTTAASSITTTTAISGGNVTSAVMYSVTAHGVCWSPSANPTIADTKTMDGTGTGVFSSSLTGLTSGVTYHIRAYATSDVGTSYGSDLTFSTVGTAPTVTTTAASSITNTTAISGGNVTNAGTSSVTARGVCWSISANPTITDDITTDGAGIGAFSSSITGLTSGVAYHIRAYATSSVGTSYGADMTFTPTEPTVSLTLNVSTGGSLSSLISIQNKTTITNLTLTGTIDARDVKFMRDEMPKLEVLDISAVSIVAYNGSAGTDAYTTSYPANTMPLYSFYNSSTYISNRKLSSIILPNTTTSIQSSAFENCEALTSVVFPGSLKIIGKKSFSWCTLLASADIPNGVTTIEDEAFTFCSGLKNLTIPNTITSIGWSSFLNCTGIVGDLNIPNSVSTIGGGAFFNCSALTGIKISNAVTRIENSTFYSCKGLSSITIPSSITLIDKKSFYSCTGLKSIYVLSKIPVDLSLSEDVFFDIDKTNCILYVPTGSKSLYQVANQWKDFFNIVEVASTTGISDKKTELITLYPNPVSDALRVKGFEGSGSFSMTDMSGRVIIDKRITSDELIRISSLPKGVYIVKIVTTNGIIEKKVIKN